MIYLYQQTEKGEQMICDSREKGGKTTQNKGEKDSEKSVLVADNCNRTQVDYS